MFEPDRITTDPARIVRGRLYRLRLKLRSIGEDLSSIARFFAIGAAILLVVELGATIAFACARRNEPKGDPRARADVYAGAKWTERHFDDLAVALGNESWDPELPRRGAFDGATL